MSPTRTLLSILLLAAPAAAQQSFASWSGFEASRQNLARFPYASTLADLDNDGDVDAAFAHSGSASVTVIRNQGGGAFGVPQVHAIANPSQCVIAADFDGDGWRDLVAADHGNNGEGTRVSLLRNTGTSFAPAVHFLTGTGANLGPAGLAAADFDADGLVDLAVANYGFLGQGSTVALLRNNGAGGFAPAVAFAAGAGPWKLSAGDLDGDGDIDLAVARDQRRISILRNQGGSFAAPEMYTVLSGSSSDAYRQLDLSDVDRDGDLDVLYVSNGLYGAVGPVVALYRNPGNAVFGAAESIPLDVFSSSPTALRVTDVTGDGWPDALVAEHQGWSFLPGNGTGGFLAARLMRAGQSPIAIDAADMDNDGDVEPVVTNRDSLELTVHWNDGNGNLPVPPTYAAGSLANSMATGDIDHDGDLDVAVTYGYTGAGGVLVLLNQGDGSFGAALNYAGPRAAMRLKMRDLDGDGWLDLLWADAASPYDFNVRLNLGNGSFGAVTTWPVHTCGSGDVEAFDVDNDGDLDVLITQYLGCAGGSGNYKALLCKNQGNALFDPPSILTTYLNTEIIGHGDLNGDGNEDVVLTSDGVEVYLGNGDGTFQPRQRFATDWGAKHLVVADLSGDGVLDLATYNFGDTTSGSGGESLSVLLGNGNGTFQPRVIYAASYSPDLGNPKGLRAVDVDADGDLDLVGGNYGSNDVSLFVNQGSGAFAAQVRFGAGMTTLDVDAADFDGDGRVDVLALVGTPPSATTTAIAFLQGRDTPHLITPFCAGDGSAIPCPCGNNGAPGNGCSNSLFAAGAHLSGSGTPSVAADSVTLSATNVTGSIAVFFQGGTQLPPTIIDDGLGCVGGPIIRLGNPSATNNASSFPLPGDPRISVRGAIPPAGATAFYQCYYRNVAAAFCPPATSNRSNGLQITWIP